LIFTIISHFTFPCYILHHYVHHRYRLGVNSFDHHHQSLQVDWSLILCAADSLHLSQHMEGSRPHALFRILISVLQYSWLVVYWPSCFLSTVFTSIFLIIWFDLFDWLQYLDHALLRFSDNQHIDSLSLHRPLFQIHWLYLCWFVPRILCILYFLCFIHIILFFQFHSVIIDQVLSFQLIKYLRSNYFDYIRV